MNFSVLLNNVMAEAFEKAGYDRTYGKVSVSNRPDLCEYQCNGAMAAAKAYHKAPIQIAEDVVRNLEGNAVFETAEAVKPGFINMNISTAFLQSYCNEMAVKDHFGMEFPEKKTIIVDYGGPNVAKPLHIGHLRSAIIGESIKRILKYMGHETIGDTHLGDWGLQIGLIIEELKERKPELPYFDPSFTGAYPEEAPFTISELEAIYPAASAKSKVDADFAERAHDNTLKLQGGDPACRAIWQHIINVSVNDLKKNYENLNVSFELWKAESDAQPYIPDMIQSFKDQGIAYVSDGALVVDVAEDTDKTEIPPCLVVKSDGASLYATTDLATIIWRMNDYHPDQMIYLADKRQDLHYTQFFRVARKAHMVEEDTRLNFIGFGTMNGKDGKPFKTRAGGVMRLEALISDINDAVYEKMKERYDESELDEKTVKQVGLAAIKYGDLSNQATKDYNFDIDRFASFEGNTGPYILYTIVRIKSILRRTEITDAFAPTFNADASGNACLKALMKNLCGFADMVENAAEELAPHKICSYIYQLSDAFNGFYHDTQILKEEDTEKKNLYLSVLVLTKSVLETCIDLLGFEAPERM